MPNFGFGSNEPDISPGGDRIGGFAQKVKALFQALYDELNSRTWNNATQSSAGYMTADDKKKLDCIYFGTCSTAAGTAAKTVSCSAFSLETGSRVIVKFTVTNTAASPTLNVNSTGAKAIQYRGAAITAGYLAANRTYAFVYDGSAWQLVGDIDTDTHYTSHLYAGTSSGTAHAATTNGNTHLILCDNTTARNRIKFTGTGATTVVSDANGVVTINSTNTTYSTFVKSGSTAAAGLVPKPSTTAGTTKYLREDATWAVPPDTDTVYTHPTSAGNKHIPSGGSSGQCLKYSAAGTAAWGTDNNTTYSNMTAASSSAAGAAGLVPAPAKGKQTSFLRGDATWVVPTDNNTTYSNMTACTTSAAGKAGLVPAPSAGVVSRCLLANATWGYPAQIATARTITCKIKIGSTTFSGNASFNGTGNVTIDLGTVS